MAWSDISPPDSGPKRSSRNASRNHGLSLAFMVAVPAPPETWLSQHHQRLAGQAGAIFNFFPVERPTLDKAQPGRSPRSNLWPRRLNLLERNEHVRVVAPQSPRTAGRQPMKSRPLLPTQLLVTGCAANWHTIWDRTAFLFTKHGFNTYCVSANPRTYLCALNVWMRLPSITRPHKDTQTHTLREHWHVCEYTQIHMPACRSMTCAHRQSYKSMRITFASWCK